MHALVNENSTLNDIIIRVFSIAFLLKLWINYLFYSKRTEYVGSTQWALQVSKPRYTLP